MRALTEADVIRIMREEWNARVRSILEKADLEMAAKVDVSGKGSEEPILSPELKVMHRSSGIRYTIDSVGPCDVILRTPEGEKFIVDAQELEKEYHLD